MIIKNKYITPEPPEFSSRELAEKFLKDGLVLASSDSDIHPHELAWLAAVAEKNNVSKHWLLEEKKNMKGKYLLGGFIMAFEIVRQRMV